MKVNRNEPCSCGSGKKYKNCCATKTISSDKSKLGLIVLTLGISVSFGFMGYKYLDHRYVNIGKFDFRIQEYRYENSTCNNPTTCTKNHINDIEIKIPMAPLK